MNSGKEVSAEDGRSSWFGTLVELIKATAWPASILLIFFYIKEPLVLTLSQLPAVIQSAQNVTVGTISISLRKAGIPSDVRAGLSKLSKEGLVLLLDTGKNGFGYVGEDWESADPKAKALRELREASLVTIAKSQPGESYPMRYSLTPAARNGYNVLLLSIISQLVGDPAAEAK
jgi:hypothetical protein